MDNSTSRFLGRLGVINYEMATHEGTANQRLASKAGEILRLDKSQVPQRHKADFMNLIDHLEKTVEKLPGLMIPVRVKGIYNSSAVKFIRLLWVIESELLELENWSHVSTRPWIHTPCYNTPLQLYIIPF